MKALVAGGAGFIGSHLTDALIANGSRVVCVDNFFIGTRRNISHLDGNSAYRFYEADICDFEALKQIFAEERPDYVFHLAANSDIQASARNPAIEYKNTYSTTYTLLECMRVFGVKRLFFASTSAVYGERNRANVAEDAGSLQPISYYGGAKLGSEGLISAYTYMNDISSLVFRFPNVIGSRLTHGVIFDFIKKLKVEPRVLHILGDGAQAKPYMHVADLVRGIIQFCDAPIGILTYNIGVDTQTTVTRIADIVCRGMGLSGVRYEYSGGNIGWKGDVPVFSYDLQKIHKAGWRAELTSDEAVIKTVSEVLA